MDIKIAILAGGCGSRLWPLSQKDFPKQFLKILNQKSLFQNSVLRNKEFGKPLIVTSDNYKYIISQQLEEINVDADIIVEPEARNTAASAIISAIFSLKNSNEVTAIVPCDHLIANESEYHKALNIAVIEANQNNLAAIGVEASSAHTEYGYFKIADLNKNTQLADKFLEKPNKENACHYFESGKYLWNSGIYIFNNTKLIDQAKLLIPQTYDLVSKSIEFCSNKYNFTQLSPEYFNQIEPISFDKSIAEKINNIAVVRSNMEWKDLGSFSSAWDLFEKDINNNYISGNVEIINAKNNFINSSNKLVAVSDVDNLVIVESEDAILISSKNSDQNIKKISNKFETKAKNKPIKSKITQRPWGSFKTIDITAEHHIKKLTVSPQKKLSLQYHTKRAEHWVILQGIAEVQIDDKIKILEKNDSIYIPIGVKHSIKNICDTNLEVIEVQTGSYFGEDDITRIEDDFGRERSVNIKDK